MSLKDKVVVEISTENPISKEYYYTDVALPATEAEIEDGIQRARIPGYSNKWADISVCCCAQLPELLDTEMDAPTLDELNFFAQRLQTLSKPEIIAMNGIFNLEKQQGKFDDGLTMKHLVNLTYGLDGVAVLTGIQTDEQLGEFVIDNDMEEFIAEMPDTGIQYLNKTAIGKAHRESEGGIYVEGGYVATATYSYPQIYDGFTLPMDDVDHHGYGVIRLEISKNREYEAAGQPTYWLNLPADNKEIQRAANVMGCGKIEDCTCHNIESTLPGIDETLFDSMKKFDQLNEIARQYVKMYNMDKVKFKAILHKEKPETLDDALKLSNMLGEYDFSYYPDSVDAFTREYLTHHLPTQFDPEYLDCLPLEPFGDKILNRLNANLTAYGVISERGRSLYDLVPYREEQEIAQGNNEQMGGMQM